VRRATPDLLTESALRTAREQDGIQLGAHAARGQRHRRHLPAAVGLQPPQHLRSAAAPPPAARAAWPAPAGLPSPALGCRAPPQNARCRYRGGPTRPRLARAGGPRIGRLQHGRQPRAQLPAGPAPARRAARRALQAGVAVHVAAGSPARGRPGLLGRGPSLGAAAGAVRAGARAPHSQPGRRPARKAPGRHDGQRRGPGPGGARLVPSGAEQLDALPGFIRRGRRAALLRGPRGRGAALACGAVPGPLCGGRRAAARELRNVQDAD